MVNELLKMATGVTPVLLSKFQKPHHAVAVLERLYFAPWRDDFQRVASGVTEDESSARRKQLRQVRVIEQLLRE